MPSVQRASRPPAAALLYRLAHQSLKGPPCLESVCICRLLALPCGEGETTCTLCAWLSGSTLPAWLPGVPPKGSPHSSLLPPVPLDRFPAVSSTAHPGIALEPLPSSSQPVCVSFPVVRACCQLSAGALWDPLHLKIRSWYTCGESCMHLTSTYSSAILTPFRQRQKIRFFPWLLRFNSHRRIVIISPDFSTFFFLNFGTCKTILLKFWEGIPTWNHCYLYLIYRRMCFKFHMIDLSLWKLLKTPFTGNGVFIIWPMCLFFLSLEQRWIYYVLTCC